MTTINTGVPTNAPNLDGNQGQANPNSVAANPQPAQPNQSPVPADAVPSDPPPSSPTDVTPSDPGQSATPNDPNVVDPNQPNGTPVPSDGSSPFNIRSRIREVFGGDVPEDMSDQEIYEELLNQSHQALSQSRIRDNELAQLRGRLEAMESMNVNPQSNTAPNGIDPNHPGGNNLGAGDARQVERHKWDMPEWNPIWNNYVYVDQQSGDRRIMDNAPEHIRTAMLDYDRRLGEFDLQLRSNPYSTIEDIAIDVFKRHLEEGGEFLQYFEPIINQAQQKVQETNQRQTVQQQIEENLYPKMFEKDPLTGDYRLEPDGSTGVLTQYGKAIMGYADDLTSAGMERQQALLLADKHLKSMQQPATPAPTQVSPTANDAATARQQFLSNQNQAGIDSINPKSNLLELAARGISKDDEVRQLHEHAMKQFEERQALEQARLAEAMSLRSG